MNKNYSYFIIVSFLYFFLRAFSEILLNTDELLFNYYAERLTEVQIKKIFSFQNKFKPISYLIAPILLLVKIALTSAILDIGCFFFSKDIKYKKLFNIVLKAEFVFLLVIICKTIWFYVFNQDYSLEDFQYFYPFSAINIIGSYDLEVWYVYPLQILNLFEVAYWFVLAYLLGKELNIATNKGLGIVASSYGVGLLIWIVVVMFLTLNIS